MPVKAAYSLKEETVKAIKTIADQTYRSQSAVVDMAVALLAQRVLDEAGAADLPAQPTKPTPPKKQPKGRKPLNPLAIPGVHKGLQQQHLPEVA